MKSRARSLARVLQNSPFFRGAPEKFFREMGQFCQESFCEKGALIIKEKSRARRLFILLRGTIAISISRGKGEIVTEIVKKKGEIFGWSALVPPRIYTATARTLEDSRVLCIESKEMEGLFHRYPSFGLLFLQRLCSLIATRLHHTRSLLAEALS